MLANLLQFIPADAQKLLLVLLLSFLIGLEREEHKGESKLSYSFGGIRTFPLIGLTGYIMAMLTQNNPIALSVGLVVVGAFMLFSYQHKLTQYKSAGVTSEISGLFTYLIGALVYSDFFWISISLVVIAVLLLELKTGLEGLAVRLPSIEVLTFTKFLLLSTVILPALPNTEFTVFHINPFKTWLVVVVISALSYGSYILQKFLGDRSSVTLSAILGGAYSSTLTTIVLAKQSKNQIRPHLYSGAIVAASGVMYLRLAILLSIFNESLRKVVSPFLFVLAIATILFGFMYSKRIDQQLAEPKEEVSPPKNPLELSAALFFAFLFVGMLVVTGLVLAHLGNIGVYLLALITGVTDVDPFIMGLTQSAGTTTPVQLAAVGVLIAAASNNVIKGAYAYFFSNGKTAKQSFGFLIALAVLGLLPLIYIL